MLDSLRYDYRRPDQVKAIERLSDPSTYPGLEPLLQRDILLQLYVVPSFAPITSWTLYKSKDDVYRIRRVRWDFAADYQRSVAVPTTFGADAHFERKQVDERLAELESFSIRAFAPPAALGIDGVTYGLCRMNFWYHAEFAWWCSPPDDWQGLSDWYHRFVAFADSALPSSTSSDRREVETRSE